MSTREREREREREKEIEEESGREEVEGGRKLHISQLKTMPMGGGILYHP